MPRIAPFLVVLFILALTACKSEETSELTHSVTAKSETAPVLSSGDAADDPAIWVHPDNPSLSLVIGTDKKRGLNVYDLNGKALHEYSFGDVNNVDVQYSIPINGRSVDIAIGSNRTLDALSFYEIAPLTGELLPIGDVTTDLTVYGSCAGFDRARSTFYSVVTTKDGEIEIFKNYEDSGVVKGERIKLLKVATQTEGCVIDMETMDLYVGEENLGVWKFSLLDLDKEGELIAPITRGRLSNDVEGVSIVYLTQGRGYIVVSSQGVNEYAVYDRQAPHTYRGKFSVSEGAFDGVSDTDGLDVVGLGLNSAFPDGLLVVQDGRNTDGRSTRYQNFKLVSWGDVAGPSGLDLEIDNSVSPRDLSSELFQ